MKLVSVSPEGKSRGAVRDAMVSAIRVEQFFDNSHLGCVGCLHESGLTNEVHCDSSSGLAKLSESDFAALLRAVGRAGGASCTIKERAVWFSRVPVLSPFCISFSEQG